MAEIHGVYVMKPYEVNAAHLNAIGNNISDIGVWVGATEVKTYFSNPRLPQRVVFKLENGEELRGDLGDWVVKNPEGDFRVIRGDRFRAYFQPKDFEEEEKYPFDANDERIYAPYDH